jgi:branched-chain amino acid transport system substrate-binding protein
MCIVNGLGCRVLLFLVVLAICGRGATATEPQGEAAPAEITVGVIIPLSGEAASFGETTRNSVNWALERIALSGHPPIRVIFEDDRLDPKLTISAYRRLRRSDQIDAVITVSSGTSNALAPIAEHDQVPMIAIASDPKIIHGRNWVVNFWVTPDEEARVTIDEALRRGYKHIARATTLQEGFLSLKSKFDELNHGKLEIVLDGEFPQAEKDFKPFLARLRAAKDVDAVMLMMMPGHLGVFAKQARSYGIKQPFFGIECFEDRNEVKVSEGALVGQWYVNADDPEGSFIEEYLKKFPGSSFWGAANAFDSLLLVAEGADREASREGINRFLHSVRDFKGSLGTYSASADNRFTLKAVVKVVTEDGFEKLAR